MALRPPGTTRRGLATMAAVTFLVVGCGTTVPPAKRALSSPGVDTTTQPGDTVPGENPSVGTGHNDSPSNPGGPDLQTVSGGSPGDTPTVASPGGNPAGPSARAPLTIGAIYSDNGSANAALGLGTSASTGPKSIINALVAALNKQGGLAGHKLAVDYYPVQATVSDYSTQANAACANFTQDHLVPVVVDFTFGTRYGMAACLAKHGVADFGIGTSDTPVDNTVGLFAAPDWMTSGRRYRAVIDGLRATSDLGPQNRIGVLLEDCDYLDRAFQRAVVPDIAQLHLNLVDTERIECTTGYSSAGPDSASISSAILHFRTDAVDRVLLVSDYEQVVLLLLANLAETQGWHPGYMLTSAAETEVVRASIPSGQWPQLHGIGWSPGLDIDDPRAPLAPADQHCIDLIKQGGVSVSGWENVFTATAECAELLFLGAALQRSGGDAHGSALMAAVGSLGTSFVAPGVVGGRTSFGPERHDGPAAEAPFAYVPACACLRYTGPPFTVP
jgi:hypothetical protein